MKYIRLLVILAAAIASLSACKRGFNIEEDAPVETEDADRIFLGANESTSWRLLIDDDNDTFTLENNSSPNSASSRYTLNGDFETTDDGWLQLNLNSSLNTEVDNDQILGIAIGETAIVLEPFTNVNDEWVPLVLSDDCPSNDLSGLAVMLNRPSNTTDDDASWIAQYTYDVSETRFEFTNGIALDPDFTSSNIFNQSSDTCTEGYVARSLGDHYLGNGASLAELDNATVNNDGYTRALGLSSRALDALEDLNSDNYVGLVREFATPDDAFNISASCTSGVCDIRLNDTPTFELSLQDSNRNLDGIDGVITAQLRDVRTSVSVLPTTRAICMANSDIDTSSNTQQILLCTAQSPSNIESPLQILLSSQ